MNFSETELKAVYGLVTKKFESDHVTPVFDEARQAYVVDLAGLRPDLTELGWRTVEQRVGNMVYRLLRHPDDPKPDHVFGEAGLYFNTSDGRVGGTWQEVS
jgi:hypothetical protein